MFRTNGECWDPVLVSPPLGSTCLVYFVTLAEMVESLLKTCDLGKRTGGDVTAGLTKEKVTDRRHSCLAGAEHLHVYCIMITGSEGLVHRITGSEGLCNRITGSEGWFFRG